MTIDRESRSLRRVEFLPQCRRYRLLLFLAIFVAALLVRWYQFDTVGFSPNRQHHSAIIARALYYQDNDAVPEWERQVSRAQTQYLSPLEPQIGEMLAAAVYRSLGREDLNVPRMLSVFWWMIGAVFLFLLARRITSDEAAWVALVFYLFLPFGMVASRSFQPDPLMIMTLLASLLAIVHYEEQPTWGRLFLAAGVSAVSIFVKAPATFLILGAFIALFISRGRMRDWRRLAVFLAVCSVPVIFYYGHNIMTGGRLSAQLASSFLPHLWIQPMYWAGWLAMIHIVIGFPALVAGIVGVAFLLTGRSRALLVGLWSAYVVYGLIMTYHIATHDYYSLMLIPIVALSLGPTMVSLLGWIGEWVPSRVAMLAIFLCCTALGMASAGIRSVEYNYDRHARWQRNERAIAQEIGELVEHSTETVFISISDGYPLMYWGKLRGVSYSIRTEALEIIAGPKRNNLEALLGPNNLGFRPKYFIVTELLEFRRAPGLSDFLFQNFPVLAHEVDYIIFDLTEQRSK